MSTRAETLMAREALAPNVVAVQFAANQASCGAPGDHLRGRPPHFVVTCARGSSDHAVCDEKYLIERYTRRMTPPGSAVAGFSMQGAARSGARPVPRDLAVPPQPETAHAGPGYPRERCLRRGNRNGRRLSAGRAQRRLPATASRTGKQRGGDGAVRLRRALPGRGARTRLRYCPGNRPQVRGDLGTSRRGFSAAEGEPASARLPVVSGARAACAPILMIQSFYTLANQVALSRGLTPDQPRRLRKITETH